MEPLISLDRALFLKMNNEWTGSWADSFFPGITDLHKSLWFALPFCAGLLALFIYGYSFKKGVMAFFAFLLTVGVSDAFGSRLVKPLFMRDRPPLTGLDLVLRCPHYGGTSFPSNHASNMFCACVFLSILFPKARWFLILVAALVSYSRVYCGVHFPIDVVGGAIQGTLIGWGAATFFLKYQHSPLRGLQWQKSL